MTMTRILIRSIIFSIIICSCLLPIYSQSRKIPKCLTGYMTDVQKWVGEDGDLLMQNDYENAIDLSANMNPVTMLSQKVVEFRTINDHYIKYLSMSRCKLTRVPPIFQLKDSEGRFLYDTLEYLTFFGNKFQDISIPGEQYDFSLNATGVTEVNVPRGTTTDRDSVWSSGFKEIQFHRLKELDLRSCLIKSLPARLFNGMMNLEALYIGENRIHYVDSYAFDGLVKLTHLDFSRNEAVDDSGHMTNLIIDSAMTFEKLENLTSLDFSFTKLLQKNMRLLRFGNYKLRRLSLCSTGLMKLEENFFAKTSLRILDVSKNPGILDGKGILNGIEDTLQVLYGTEISLSDFEIFYKFHQLEILQLSNNEISLVDSIVAKTLMNLQILDLNKNRMTTWFEPTFSIMPSMKLLSLKDNNINVISENMIEDLSHIKYIALSGNFIVCNCYTRQLYDLALRNENMTAPTLHSRLIGDKEDLNTIVRHHNAFQYFNRLVSKRTIVTSERDKEDCIDEDVEGDGDFLLIDYDPQLYSCLLISESRNIRFSEVVPCNKNPRGIGYDKIMDDGYNKLLILLIIPSLMLPLAIGFVYRRNFRYCFITFKNSTMLSLINKQDAVDDDTIFNYDVFVSYCNEDRGWVLDHLLPHLEADCSISACLHERDFQVGLSILENIVSCMDRSKSIMLIISQQFLLSQWCQFEMHLAQHRLLETRREDLTLVLLEDIPRRLRPNTLHYLMLTKTYIVWPKDESQRTLFWRRLKKSFVTQKWKQTENVSLA